jgi:hypothetical protein
LADNIELSSGSGGATVKTDEVSSVHIPCSKIVLGADNTDGGYVSSANPLPVSDAGGTLTVDGTVAATQSGTWNVTNVSGTVSLPTGAATAAKQPALGTAGTASSDVLTVQGIASMTALKVDGSAVTQPVSDGGSTLSVDDGAGSLTVDNAALSVTGGGAEASALRVTLASDSTGVLSVDDNGSTLSVDDGGGALTVDGTVAATQSGTWNITNVSGTVSLPTGAATAAKQPALGTAGTASSDVITIQGVASMTPLQVADNGSTLSVDDGAGSLTVDNAALSVTGGGAEATALRVTLASDSTGVLSVDDNGSTLSVDDGGASLTVDGTVTANLAAGTNNIGDVDVLTQPARARTTDTISAALATDVLMNDTTALTPKFAVIDVASSGDNTLVAAVVGKKIRVLSLFLVAAGAVNVRLESGAGGTALTGQMNLAANGGFVLPPNVLGWCETASNTLLNLELSGAVSVDGALTYVEV